MDSVRTSHLVRLSPLAPPPRRAGAAALPPDRFEPAENPPPPPSRGWLRKVLWGGLAATSALGAVGGIAYIGNHQALQEMGKLQFYPQSLPLPHSQPPTNHPKPPTYPAPALQVAVEGHTVREFLDEFSRTPQVRRQVEQRLQQAQRELQTRIGQVLIPQGEVLLDVQTPLPTSDQSFLHLGQLNLPSAGYRALQSEPLPASLRYAPNPIQTGLKIHLTRVPVEKPIAGPGLLLGAVRVDITSPDGHIDLKGKVGLDLDLDGQASQRQLQKLQGKPGQEPLRQQLRQRQQNARRIQQKLQAQGLTEQVQQVAHQEVDFQAKLSVPKALASSTLYIWSVPDQTGDGRADLQITQKDLWGGLDHLQLSLQDLRFGADPPNASELALRVRHRLQQAIAGGLRDQLPQLDQLLKDQVKEEVRQASREGLKEAEKDANQQLQRLYKANQGRLDLHGSDPNGPRLRLDLGAVRVQGDQLLVGFSTPQDARAVQSNTANAGLRPGQMSLGVPLSAFNQQLRDRSQGGAVQWNQLLDGMRSKAGLRSLEFGKDAKGRPIYPQLRMEKGRLNLNAEVIAKTKTGLGPIFDGMFGSTVHTRLVMPLEVKTVQGRLVISADQSAMEYQKAQSEAPFDLLDLMPTRILTNLLANVLVGTGTVHPGAGANTELDLAKTFGIQFEQATLDPQGNLKLVTRVGPQAARWLADQVSR